jgi:hypothetical protein
MKKHFAPRGKDLHIRTSRKIPDQSLWRGGSPKNRVLLWVVVAETEGLLQAGVAMNSAQPNWPAAWGQKESEWFRIAIVSDCGEGVVTCSDYPIKS